MNVERGSPASLSRKSDVLIIGGGPAGSTAAILTKQRDRKHNSSAMYAHFKDAQLLRMKEALLGLLAGDIYSRTPIWMSLRAFKAVYYIVSLANLRRSLSALRRRRINIQPVEPQLAAPDRMTAV